MNPDIDQRLAEVFIRAIRNTYELPLLKEIDALREALAEAKAAKADESMQQRAEAWSDMWRLLLDCGMEGAQHKTGRQVAMDFIRDLHQFRQQNPQLTQLTQFREIEVIHRPDGTVSEMVPGPIRTEVTLQRGDGTVGTFPISLELADFLTERGATHP